MTPGRPSTVSKHPVLSCAKSLKHETCPFRGRRVVLVAYSLQAADQANSSDQELLKSLKFNWPRLCDLQNPNPNPPRILHGTDEAPRVVPSIAQVFSGDGSLISGFRGQAGIPCRSTAVWLLAAINTNLLSASFRPPPLRSLLFGFFRTLGLL